MEFELSAKITKPRVKNVTIVDVEPDVTGSGHEPFDEPLHELPPHGPGTSPVPAEPAEAADPDYDGESTINAVLPCPVLSPGMTVAFWLRSFFLWPARVGNR